MTFSYVDAVFNLILFFSSFGRSSGGWELRTKSLCTVAIHPLIGTPQNFNSLSIVTSDTKPLGFVENVLPSKFALIP